LIGNSRNSLELFGSESEKIFPLLELANSFNGLFAVIQADLEQVGGSACHCAGLVFGGTTVQGASALDQGNSAKAASLPVINGLDDWGAGRWGQPTRATRPHLKQVRAAPAAFQETLAVGRCRVRGCRRHARTALAAPFAGVGKSLRKATVCDRTGPSKLLARLMKPIAQAVGGALAGR
jgi:hypothetical protein